MRDYLFYFWQNIWDMKCCIMLSSKYSLNCCTCLIWFEFETWFEFELKAVAEPPKLLGPHAPVLVSKTSDGYACAPDNLTGSVWVSPRTLDKPLTTRTAGLSKHKSHTNILQWNFFITKGYKLHQIYIMFIGVVTKWFK